MPKTTTSKSTKPPTPAKSSKSSKSKSPKRSKPVPPATHIEIISRGVIIQNGHVLLCRNRKGNYYYLPGGHVDPGENSADALARECVEEFGGKVAVGDLLAVAEVQFATKKGMNQELNLLYAAELVKPSAKKDLPQVTSKEDWIDFAWLMVEEVAAADVRPDCFQDWLVETMTGAE